MATIYIKSGSGTVPLANQAWATGSPGDRMVPTRADASANVAVARRYVWECTTAGTSTGTPTWPAAVTVDTTTVTQNGVVWTSRRPGFANFTASPTVPSWAMATIYVDYSGLLASGDTAYISNNHAESQGTSNVSATGAAGTAIYSCVNDGAAPPTASATTATVTTTSTVTITVNSYWYGVTFIQGSGDNTSSIMTAINGIFESCSFQLATTGASATIRGTPSNWKNTSVKFAAAGQTVNGNTISGLVWTGGSLASGSTSPTALVGNGVLSARISGLDLSSANAAINLVSSAVSGVGFDFFDVQTPASWSGSVNSATPGINSYTRMTNGDNTGTNYVINQKDQFGTLVQDTSIYRTGGASNGVTNMSWKITTVAGAGLFPQKFTQTPEIVKWFPITGFTVANPVTVTLHFIRDNATAMNDDEIWAEAMYLATSGAPLGTIISNAKASVVASASAQPSDSGSSWVGTGGFSNANKQKLVLTFTPNLAGIIHIVVKVCKASVTALYLDPQVDFS